MAYSGKIAFNLTNVGKVNYDCMDIKFLPANANTPTSINDFVQVNKVYAIPAGVTVTSIADLQNYVVWELLNRTLVAGDKCVAIEYTPTNDITITGIEIFTNSSNTSTAGRVKIIHSSGVFIAAFNGDGKEPNSEELYSLTGYKRYVNNISVTLYKDETYYIVYNDSTPNNYYPAYFQNETGNYKEYSNDWGSGSIMCADLTQLYNFIGHIGSGNISGQDKAAILALNADDTFIWIGYDSSQFNIYQNHYYHRKTKSVSVNVTVDIPSDTNTPNYRMAKVMCALKTNTAVLQNGDIQGYFNHDGMVAELKSGYTSCIDSSSQSDYIPVSLNDVPTTGLVDKGLYYIQNEVRIYESGNWLRPYQYSVNDANYLTYPDIWGTDFEDLNLNYTAPDSNFVNATLKTDRKYYVKLTDSNNNSFEV